MDTFGRKFRVSIFGESHGPEVGVLLDGVPAGLPLAPDDFEPDLARRRSGAKGTTPRKESDVPEIRSGLYNGRTTGAPLLIAFKNLNTSSEDYSGFVDMPRPGHADLTGSLRFDGFNDPRGGGHFSGRLTTGLVAAGTVARKVLDGVTIQASLVALGGETDTGKWEEILDSAISEQDSVGGIVECRVDGMAAGVGEPFFDSVESLISHAVFSIPGVRGIEFGDGFKASSMKGSEHNDPIAGPDGRTLKNGAGGINGGLTNGNRIVFKVAFKPTSTIGKTQLTYNLKSGTQECLTGRGRHDVCFALRTPVIVESVAAIVLADLYLMR